MRKISYLLTLFIAALTAQPALAWWARNASVELLVNISDVIVLADVSDVKRIEPLTEDWDSQNVTCKPRLVLKGSQPGNLTFRQDYCKDRTFRERKNSYREWPLLPHQKVLIFYAKPRFGDDLDLVY